MFCVFLVVMLFIDAVVRLVLMCRLSALVFTSNPALGALMIQPALPVVNGTS